MSSRRIAAALGLALLLATPGSVAQAQFGGLVKKAKDKIAPTSTAQPSTDEPARLPGPVLTPEVVDHFLVGLRAENVEQDRQAKERERQRKERQRREAAEFRRQNPEAAAAGCRSDAMHEDPRAAELDSLSKVGETATQQNDVATAQQVGIRVQTIMLAMQARADSVCASLKPEPEPPPEQEAMQAASVPPGEAGASAAGMTAVVYGQVRELLFTYLQDPARAGLSPEEKQAVDPKRAELVAAFHALEE